MKAIILVAGRGTRFYPFSYYRPKPLFLVCNKPIMQHIIENLVKLNIKEIILVIGYKGSRIKNYFGDGHKLNCSLKYIHQDEPKGTADALLGTERMINEDFLCIYGDVLFPIELLEGLIREWNKAKEFNNVFGVIALKEIEEPWKYITVGTKENRIIKFSWKARVGHYLSNLAFTGVCIFKREIFSYLDRASLTFKISLNFFSFRSFHNRSLFLKIHVTFLLLIKTISLSTPKILINLCSFCGVGGYNLNLIHTLYRIL